MFLYHCTLDLDHNGYFIPRTPEGVDTYEEDGETPRICFAPSIEQCLTSVPFGGYNLEECLLDNNRIIKVFRITITPQMVENGLVITPEELHRTGKVHDAYWTKEHWIMQQIQIPKADTIYLGGTRLQCCNAKQTR